MENNSFDWMNHPSLKNIDAAKLQMLMTLANQGMGKTQNELLPFLMAAASQSKSGGLSFSREETEQILHVIKQGKSPQETARIDQIVRLAESMQRPRRG